MSRVRVISHLMDPWLAKSDEELLMALGEAVASLQHHAVPPSPARLLELATIWLAANMARVEEALCSSTKIQAHARRRERELLFEATCEVLVHVVAHVPAGCVAAYCIRKGVDVLCAKRWQAGDPEPR